MTALSPQILALLVCPACRGALAARAADAVACVMCGRVYAVRDAIPVLVVGEEGVPASGTGV